MTGHYTFTELPDLTRQRLAAFGDALRVTREERGMSARQVARVTGLSPNTVLRAESGANFELPPFLALAAWAGIPLAWFDGSSGEGLDAWAAGFEACAARVGAAVKLDGGPS